MKYKREFTGELIGTFILVLFGCGSVGVTVLFGAHQGLFQIAMTWGIAVTLAIYATRHLSCAHLKPALPNTSTISATSRSTSGKPFTIKPPEEPISIAMVGATAAQHRRMNGFDLSNAVIPVNEIHSGGPPRDGISSINHPTFIASGAVDYMQDADEVVSVTIGEEPRAYPLRILVRHGAQFFKAQAAGAFHAAFAHAPLDRKAAAPVGCRRTPE